MQNDKPNIVLITTDQQRFDTFGSYAPPYMRTPHLDYLSNDGITFSRAYADCPVCVPGRAAVMTGKSVFSHGMGINDRTNEYFTTENTLPTLLRQCGYQTCGIGKMHFHPQHIRHGFDETHPLDEYYRWIARSGSLEQPRRHGLGENELYATMATVPESLTLTSWITEQAVDYITERRDPTMPFFTWISYSKPHPPLDPPEPYYSMYRNCAISIPEVGEWARSDRRPSVVKRQQMAHSTDKMSDTLIREAKAAYYGLITHIDYNIGRIMAALQDTGPFFSANDNTLIIFSSDHGEYLFDHKLGAKGQFLEGSAHIPFIVRMPRTWKNRIAGTTNKNVVSPMDILPTIVNAAGGSVPEAVDGIDLIGMVRETVQPRPYLIGGQGMSKRRPEAISWIGITDGCWKYMWYFDDGTELMFNLENDPYELHELSADSSFVDKKKELQKLVITELETRGGLFLENGMLKNRGISPVPDEIIRTKGFPGWMRDQHPSDAVH